MVSRRRTIPTFTLYGESPGPAPEMLHIEPIQWRSRQHRWEIDVHTHRALHQIVWVASGPADVVLEGTREAHKGPLAVVVPPNVVHAFRFAPETDGHVITFDARAVIEGNEPATGEALQALFATPRALRLEDEAPATARIAALVRELQEEFAAADAAGSPVLLWLARAIVWRLARLGLREARPDGKARNAVPVPFTRFLVLVEAHHHEHWSASRYADRLGLTLERLNRLTRSETGQSALELVHARLAREACRRLVYIAAPVSQLAFELGFEDPAYFCRFFKRQVGCSPREYRRRSLAGSAPA